MKMMIKEKFLAKIILSNDKLWWYNRFAKDNMTVEIIKTPNSKYYVVCNGELDILNYHLWEFTDYDIETRVYGQIMEVDFISIKDLRLKKLNRLIEE